MWQCSLFGSYASAEQQIIHISPLAGFETKHGVHNYSYGISELMAQKFHCRPGLEKTPLLTFI